MNNLQRSSATEYIQKNCEDGYINFDKSLQKFEDERDKVDNEFYNNYMQIIDALQGKSTTIFVGLSQYYVEDFICSTFKIPSVLIDGANDKEIQFAGLETYRKTFKNFKFEQNNLTTSLLDFQEIISKNFNEKSQNLLNQTNNFITQTQTSKVPNMNSNEKVPNSAAQMTIGINNKISSEIEQTSLLGSKIDSAANTGLLFVSAPLRTLVDAALVQVDANLERIITKIENLLEPITKDMDDTKKYIVSSLWIIFAFFILIIILLTWVVVIATCYNSKNKCANQLQCGRTILVILSFLLFFLGILLFILATGSVILSGACGFIFDINSDKVSLLYEFDNLNKDSLKAAEICLFRNSTGDMTELAATEVDAVDKSVKGYMMSIYEILESFSKYRLWHTQQDQQQLESQQMLDFEKELDQLGINGEGDQYDFYNVQSTLEELNDLVSCNDQNYQLKTKNCQNQSQCKVIQNNSIFESPTCTDDSSKASQLYTTLQNYTTKENIYIDDTTNRLISLSLPESPNTNFKELLTNLNSVNNNMQNVENKLSGTLQPIIETGHSWMEIEDCRQMRKLMIEFEVVTCHHLNYNVYIFFVVVFIASYFLMVMLWILFCLLRKKDTNSNSIKDGFYSNDTGLGKELKDEKIPMS